MKEGLIKIGEIDNIQCFYDKYVEEGKVLIGKKGNTVVDEYESISFIVGYSKDLEIYASILLKLKNK